jgi:hypothetical protein
VRSLRTIADCIGVKGLFQVARDFFGYATGAPRQVSLLRQLRLMKQYHVHINLIRVGIESFTDADERELDSAVAFMRDTYASVDFGVGRVARYSIATDDARGREHIASDREAEDLTEEWSVPNKAMDVFCVLSYAGSTVGSAPLEGPEDKDRTGPMTGVVLAIEGNATVTGFVLAKEVCRYLGLRNSDNSNNLMFATLPNGGNLTREQGAEMVGERFLAPFVKFPCGAHIEKGLGGGYS